MRNALRLALVSGLLTLTSLASAQPAPTPGAGTVPVAPPPRPAAVGPPLIAQARVLSGHETMAPADAESLQQAVQAAAMAAGLQVARNRSRLIEAYGTVNLTVGPNGRAARVVVPPESRVTNAVRGMFFTNLRSVLRLPPSPTPRDFVVRLLVRSTPAR